MPSRRKFLASIGGVALGASTTAAASESKLKLTNNQETTNIQSTSDPDPDGCTSTSDTDSDSSADYGRKGDLYLDVEGEEVWDFSEAHMNGSADVEWNPLKDGGDAEKITVIFEVNTEGYISDAPPAFEVNGSTATKEVSRNGGNTFSPSFDNVYAEDKYGRCNSNIDMWTEVQAEVITTKGETSRTDCKISPDWTQ